MPLNILIIYDCIYPESLGGVEHRNYWLAQALVKRGHHVTLAGWMEHEQPPVDGVTMLPMAFREKLYDSLGKRSALTSFKFALAVLKLDLRAYDIIETANIPYIHLLPLSFMCAVRHKPLIVTWYEFFGRTWWQYKSGAVARLFCIIEKLCAQLGMAVNASCDLTAQRLQKARILGHKVPVIPCGISLARMKYALTETKKAPPLIYAGRLMKEKRIDLLLHALSKLAYEADGVWLTIIGDGPDRAALEQLTQELQLEARVRFLGRLPSSDDVWRIMAASRIAVQPSQREGFGMFPLEALALGLPVVYCEAPDNAVGAIVRDDVEGLCSKPDSYALAAALEKLLKNPQLWQEYSANAKRRAEDYDWDTIAGTIEQFFLATIGTHP